MANENRWRARKIQGELSKLGIGVSLDTISRYLPKAEPDPGCQQRWTTFLGNHRDLIAGMDFFVVPTVRFQLLYVWFAINLLTQEDWEENCDQERTNGVVYLRSSDWYRRRLRRHFILAGEGLSATPAPPSRGSPPRTQRQCQARDAPRGQSPLPLARFDNRSRSRQAWGPLQGMEEAS
jgi:hypothetical protein